MANIICRASILQFQLLLQPTLSNRNSFPKKSNVLCFASSQFNPVRSEASFSIGTHLIPHPNKVERGGGEDAFFISNFNGGVIAVADGVSGYNTLFWNSNLFF
ncbi:hypothetical protein CRYUN_Cryun02cG0212000 [Craigia yunnanensis]